MKDLNRLLEEPGADPLEVNLLQLARSEGPSAESRRRILAGLAVGIAAGTISAPSDAAQKATRSAASSAAVKWGVASVVAIGASVVAFLSLQPKPHTPVVTPLSNTASAIVVPVTAPAAAVSGELVPVTKVEDLPTLAEGSGSDSPKSVSAPSLAEEVAAIKSAKGALASGNAAQALRELDAYKLHFPRGRLSQEASVVRIEALIGSGNQAAASAVADHFLAAHPDSPYSARVRTLVGR
jgi:Outer membrane lipoprotein